MAEVFLYSLLIEFGFITLSARLADHVLFRQTSLLCHVSERSGPGSVHFQSSPHPEMPRAQQEYVLNHRLPVLTEVAQQWFGDSDRDFLLHHVSPGCAVTKTRPAQIAARRQHLIHCTTVCAGRQCRRVDWPSLGPDRRARSRQPPIRSIEAGTGTPPNLQPARPDVFRHVGVQDDVFRPKLGPGELVVEPGHPADGEGRAA